MAEYIKSLQGEKIQKNRVMNKYSQELNGPVKRKSSIQLFVMIYNMIFSAQNNSTIMCFLNC